MSLSKILALVSVSAAMTACTYQVPVVATPNLNVYSSYSSKLPGNYLLYVEDDALVQSVKATGIACAAHSYPVDARAAFRDATLQTVEQLVEHVELVDTPVQADLLTRQGKAGMIIVRGNEIQARFVMVPGFMTSSSDANVDMTASVSVDGPGGRLFGSEASGSGHANGPSGGMCSGPEQAIAEATGKAMKQLLGQVGERMSNAPRLRSGLSEAGGIPIGPVPDQTAIGLAKAGRCDEAKTMAGSQGDIDTFKKVDAICRH